MNSMFIIRYRTERKLKINKHKIVFQDKKKIFKIRLIRLLSAVMADWCAAAHYHMHFFGNTMNRMPCAVLEDYHQDVTWHKKIGHHWFQE